MSTMTPGAMDDTGGDLKLFTSLRYDPALLARPEHLASCQTSSNGSVAKPCPFYMLPYHRDRILDAARHFGWHELAAKLDGPAGYDRLLLCLLENVDTTGPGPLRVKVDADRNGDLQVTHSPVLPVLIANLVPRRLPSPSGAARPVVSPLTGGSLSLGEGDYVDGDARRGEEPWEVVPSDAREQPSSYTSFKTTQRAAYDRARAAAGISVADRKEVLIVSAVDGSIMEGSLTSVYLWRNGQWTTPSAACGGQLGTTRKWALRASNPLCVEGVIPVDSLIDGEECWLSNGVRGFIWGRIKL